MTGKHDLSAPKLTRCEQCGKFFTPLARRSKAQRFCGKVCRQIAYRLAHPQMTSGLGLAQATVGAVAEMMAACDLMRRGYEVFRALSSACSCDLIALAPGALLRIEVRSGVRGVSGALSFPRNGVRGKRLEQDLDHYCVIVHRTNEIIYIPPLPEDGDQVPGDITDLPYLEESHA